MDKLVMPVPAKLRGKIAPEYFAHVVLKTSKFKKMLVWHKTVFEAQVSYEFETAAFLTFDDEHHRIAIANIPLLFRRWKLSAGVDHIAFTYGSLEKLLLNYERLKGYGILPAWCIHHGATVSMYYVDPDKNWFELQVDVFDSPDKLLAWAETPDFQMNPIGVDFDPDDMLAEFKSGTPVKELMRREPGTTRHPSSMPTAYLGIVHKCLLKLHYWFGPK